MNDCIFCKIVNGDIPSYKIYEDDNFLAFLDIHPATEGYTLVIPKKHYRWVWDVENVGEYFEVCKLIANHYQKVSDSEGVYSMILGEEVPHAHIRIIPDEGGNYLKEIVDFLQSLEKRGIVKDLSPAKALKVLKKYKLS